MRMLMCGLTLSVGFIADDVKAQNKVNVDGTEYEISVLMDNCTKITGAPEAQLACFNSVSELLEKQNVVAPDNSASVTNALNALRTVAQYQDDGSGLSIAGADCKIQILYFNNYYYLSRRNVSSLDLFSAQFDVSKLQYDRTAEVRGAQAPLYNSLMENGAKATMHGGIALESNQYKFEPKSARMRMDTYANEVVSQLPAIEDQAFDFVLVHPARSKASADIWRAFEAFVDACQT